MNWTSSTLLSAVFLALAAQLCVAEDGPGPAEIEAILRDRIDSARRSVGIVVGIVDEQGSRVISYGRLSSTGEATVDGDTLYEIGSATKVFTAILLADQVEHGELKLEDPISKFLPASVKAPSRKGRQITLADLATHTSGLPRMPDNFNPANNANPYADYTLEQMYEFLSGYTLPRDIGESYEYSNYGFGLLGQILARKAGVDYETLVRERICRPLGMNATVIMLPPPLKGRLAQGHNTAGRAVPNWELSVFAGAGGLRSSANDLLKFLAANLGLTPTELLPAMRRTHQPRHEAGSATMHIGLGWHIADKYGTELVWHNGGTGGYHSFLGFDQRKQRGVVVLSNSANSIDDIGFHLLEPKYELARFAPVKARTAVHLEAKVLAGLAGRYQFAPQVFLNVRPQGDHLAAQLTGQSWLDLFPENDHDFFYEAVNAQITFVKDAQGEVGSLVLHQNQADQEARRISSQLPAERVAIRLDPAVYENYPGNYELAPGVLFTVKREGSRLLVKLTGQSFLEVFPESETEFFYKVVDAQITFVKDAKSGVTALVLHQNGRDQTARRLP